MTLGDKRYELDPIFRTLVETLQLALADGLTTSDLALAVREATRRHGLGLFLTWLDEDPELRVAFKR